jgi:hypothetical protein
VAAPLIYFSLGLKAKKKKWLRGAGWLALGSGAVCVLLAALLAVSNKSRDFEHAARRCDSWQAHKQLTHNVISENVFQGPPSATQKKRAERKESIFIKASIFILDPPGPSFLSLCVLGALKLPVMFLHMRDKLLDFPVTPLSPRLIYGGQKYCLHNNSIEAINRHHLP